MNILLHICCSNCALYPFKILSDEGHSFTGYWYNPNIHPPAEYESRLASVRKLTDDRGIRMLYSGEYMPSDYFRLFRLDNEYMMKNIISDRPGSLNGTEFPPSPERCGACYSLRLEKTAATASEKGYDAFSTTLLISPYQDFEKIAGLGGELGEKYKVLFHLRDYRQYFREAMALSKELGLYRQKYCGCIFSREERAQERPPSAKSRRAG